MLCQEIDPRVPACKVVLSPLSLLSDLLYIVVFFNESVYISEGYWLIFLCV